jgi:copper chaperone CopZ
MIRKTYQVAGMTCPNCAMLLEGMEDELPGIHRVIASYRKGIVEVEYDPEQVTEAHILQAISRLGYQVEATV